MVLGTFQPFRNDNQLESDLESGESFPLLEPEPRKDSIYCDTKNKLHLPVYRSKSGHTPNLATDNPLLALHENGVIGDQSRYQSDCETCQQNWDLLNRNQALAAVDDEAKTKDSRSTEANPACLNFDLDGLLPSVDQQQVRLGQILAAKDVSLCSTSVDLHSR